MLIEANLSNRIVHVLPFGPILWQCDLLSDPEVIQKQRVNSCFQFPGLSAKRRGIHRARKRYVYILHATRFIKAKTKMENMTDKENLFFDPTTGKLCTSRPANDKAIAVDMNKQGSGGFFLFIGKGSMKNFVRSTLVADLEFKVEFSALRSSN